MAERRVKDAEYLAQHNYQTKYHQSSHQLLSRPLQQLARHTASREDNSVCIILIFFTFMLFAIIFSSVTLEIICYLYRSVIRNIYCFRIRLSLITRRETLAMKATGDR